MTALVLAPNQDDIQTVLRDFLLDILPDGIEVVEGQDNRVPEPLPQDYVLFTCTSRPRLATNIDESVDGTAIFLGFAIGEELIVTAVESGVVSPGPLFGPGVIAGTTVVRQIAGTAWEISPAQTLPPAVYVAGPAGRTMEQKTEIVFQLDVHGPSSANNAQTISTMLRDPYGTEFFAAENPEIAPLYADDPRQVPFIDGEEQWDTRWVVEAHLQANQVVSGVSQEFAASYVATVINVEATYPP